MATGAPNLEGQYMPQTTPIRNTRWATQTPSAARKTTSRRRNKLARQARKANR